MRLRDHDAIKSRFDAFGVDPRQLKVTEGFNVRDFSTPRAREELEILKEQIREAGGVLVPLEVRMVSGEIHIVSGHRRHRSVMELIAEGMDIQSVPAVAEAVAVNDAERLFRLHDHNSGTPLTMLEKAELTRRLMTMGFTREQIATRWGYKTPQQIANFELLCAAPEAVKQAVRDQEIAPTTAIELVRHHGDDAGKELVAMQEAATGSGRKKPSSRDVRAAAADRPKGGSTAFQIEQRNKKLLAEHEDQQIKDVSAAEAAIELLCDLAKRNVKPRSIAEMLTGCEAGPSETALRWLNSYCDALQKQNAT